MKPSSARAPLAALVLSLGCSREPPSPTLPADAGLVDLAVRVPAALSIARGIDELSVTVDPSGLGLTHVTVHAGMVVGVEADVLVYAQGRPRPLAERKAVRAAPDFDVCSSTWTTGHDGVPAPGTTYVVEARIELFETDIAPAREWNPHAGAFRALWTRTLRQAEE